MRPDSAILQSGIRGTRRGTGTGGGLTRVRRGDGGAQSRFRDRRWTLLPGRSEVRRAPGGCRGQASQTVQTRPCPCRDPPFPSAPTGTLLPLLLLPRSRDPPQATPPVVRRLPIDGLILPCTTPLLLARFWGPPHPPESVDPPPCLSLDPAPVGGPASSRPRPFPLTSPSPHWAPPGSGPAPPVNLPWPRPAPATLIGFFLRSFLSFDWLYSSPFRCSIGLRGPLSRGPAPRRGGASGGALLRIGQRLRGGGPTPRAVPRQKRQEQLLPPQSPQSLQAWSPQAQAPLGSSVLTPQPRPGRPPVGRPAGTPSAAGQVSDSGQGRGSGGGESAGVRGRGRGSRVGVPARVEPGS